MRHMKINLLIVFILFNILIPIKSSAEMLNNAKFEKVSIEEGLSNEYVTSIFQDSKGYIWIGTKDGLNRFDGEKVKIYNCNAENKNSLSSTYINDIEEDVNGNIWIATDSGLDFLVTDSDTITRMRDWESDKYNLGNLKITSLLKSEQEEHIMWVGTEKGLIKVDVLKNKMEAFYHNENDSNSLTNSYITCLENGENNTLWVGTKRGVNLIDKDLKISEKKNREIKLEISNMEKDKQGNMWISTKGSIFVFNIKEKKSNIMYEIDNERVTKLDVNGNEIEQVYKIKNIDINLYNNFIFNDSNNNTWISSSDGAIRISKDNIDIFRQDVNLKNSITSNIVTCFYEDANGTIWVGTDKGANILNNNIQFSNFNKKEISKKIVSILEHNNQIWVVTKFNGIYIYDIKSGDLVNKLCEERDLVLDNRYIKNLFRIDEQYILIVTNKEVIPLDTNDYSYKKLPLGDGYSSELSYIYNDGKNIWIASTTDFYSYNIKTGEKTYYSEGMSKFEINPGRIKYILQDNKDENIIWLGGIDTGLIKFHKEKGVLNIYTADSTNDSSIINNYINCIAFDNSGNLWIGTNIGLSKFDVKNNKFSSYTTANGLTNNFINSILIDDSNNIWLSTNKGLNKFDTEKENFINFTKMDGLYVNQFNLNSSLKVSNGYMVFGSTNGCVYFNPDDVVDYKIQQDEIVIGDIFIDQNKVIYDGKELTLEYNYKDLSIDYFLPIYENLNNITYEYMLEGIDLDWIYIDSRSRLDFKSLEPGKYTLRIRARDGHGELTKETRINIRVKNPIWKTPLAYLIYVSIALIIAIYILNYVKILQCLVDQKTINLNNQLEENKRLSQEIIDQEKFKNNYFVNLSHELRTPINVIVSTVQLINVVSKRKDLTQDKFNEYMDIIRKNCDNLLKIINDIIDSSKIETGKYKINKKNNDIVYIVEETVLNMSKFIEDSGLSLIIDPDMEEKIISCDETEIERCVVNLLANAVKFTNEGGEIRVYIKEVEDYIEITVEDTGIGISKEDQEFIFKRFSQVGDNKSIKVSSSGIGLTFVKYIAELHNGYIKLESEINKGSKFIIGLPDIIENTEYNNDNL